MATPDSGDTSLRGRHVVALVLPFYLNDLFNIFVQSFQTWLILDYSARVLVLIAAYAAVSRSRHNPIWNVFRFPKAVPFRVEILKCVALGFCITFLLGPILSWLPPETRLGRMPAPGVSDQFLETFDIIFGVPLVAISEEVVFRGILISYLLSAGMNSRKALYYSAILFGLIHWSSGLFPVLNASLIGFVFGHSRLKTGSIIAPIIAHWLIDFLIFS